MPQTASPQEAVAIAASSAVAPAVRAVSGGGSVDGGSLAALDREPSVVVPRLHAGLVVRRFFKIDGGLRAAVAGGLDLACLRTVAISVGSLFLSSL